MMVSSSLLGACTFGNTGNPSDPTNPNNPTNPTNPTPSQQEIVIEKEVNINDISDNKIVNFSENLLDTINSSISKNLTASAKIDFTVPNIKEEFDKLKTFFSFADSEGYTEQEMLSAGVLKKKDNRVNSEK